MDQADGKTIIFSCPPELEPILPRPMPAVLGLPDWFKAMPQKSFNPSLGETSQTVKRCPPFIDAMTYGFLIPLATDLKVENGEFSWDWTLPGGTTTSYTHSPIDFHDPSQIAGTPFHDDDRYVIKFNNFWTIRTPPGYSLLFMHPINRPDLPFTSITGLVDCDHFQRQPAQFPGALARRRLQRRAAEGHAGRPMPANQARGLGRQFRRPCGRSGDAAQRNARGIGARDRRLPPAVPRSQALARAVAQKSHRLARPQPEAAMA